MFEADMVYTAHRCASLTQSVPFSVLFYPFYWLECGVTAGGKVLVNDPNDSSSKNYINREFDMMTEVHATANAYWIFAKK